MATLRHKAIAILLVVLAAAPLAAQQPPPQLPAGMSAQDLRARLQASGLAPAQIRQMLASRGYDPALLDSYLSDSAAAVAGAPTPNLFSALRALQVPALDSLLVVPPVVELPESYTDTAGPRIFGLAEFRTPSSLFQPLVTGPVAGSYIVGPGDELILVLTGDVEAAYTLPVTRDGFVVIPRVGQVFANGVALDQLRDQLYTHLGRVYSGVRRGAGATTRFSLSLGRLRTNQVFVSGEVARPGTYLLSPVASVMNGLYLAGGPRPGASLRNIQVVRGGRVVHRVDLYAYLLRGDNLDSVRLEPGDVVFVPLAGDLVTIQGEVHRPARFETRPGESLVRLIQHAGGLTAPASVRRARISRMLAPNERREPGVDRVVMDVDLAAALADSANAPTVRPGDEIHVFPVRGELRNLVTLQGAVWQPGSFGWTPGMRAWDLIGLANGLTPRANRSRGHIARLNLADSTMTLVTFSLDTLPGGAPRENPELREFDAVTVFDVTTGFERYFVNIAGEVQAPQQVEFLDGMTLRDLLIRAGGLTPQADIEIEVARFADQLARERGALADIARVRVDSSYVIPQSMLRFYLGHRDSLSARLPLDEAAQFQLQPYDQVLVRRVPYFALPRAVIVTGEVRSPGRYALRLRGEQLVSLIQDRAGGLTPQAFAGGFRLYRAGRLVNVDLERALRDPGSNNNVALEEGDSLHIPEFEAVVVVQGAVNSPSTVLYRPGAGLDYYIENAGGYASNADAGRTNVRYANGEARVRKRSLLFFRSSPAPGPGSTVTVPAKTNLAPFDWRGLIADALQIITAVTTIIIITNNN